MVPTGSPSRGGDVAVYAFDTNQHILPTPFYSVLVSVSVLMALSTIFHSINFPNNSPLSRCSFGLITALLVLSTIYLFMKVSLSPDLSLVVDWAQNTNYLPSKCFFHVLPSQLIQLHCFHSSLETPSEAWHKQSSRTFTCDLHGELRFALTWPLRLTGNENWTSSIP